MGVDGNKVAAMTGRGYKPMLVDDGDGMVELKGPPALPMSTLWRDFVIAFSLNFLLCWTHTCFSEGLDVGGVELLLL